MTIIIGAGLSGLLTAYRLKKEGVPFKILDARTRIGGRINTVYGTNETPVEMGATWFYAQHVHLLKLLEELNIEYFEQHMENTVFFQASSNSPIQTMEIPKQAPSYRISGGSSHLINTLFLELNKEDVFLNQSVKEIKFQNNSFQVFANDVFEGDSVVLAIPPKLWTNRINFDPELPKDLSSVAKETHTWMEDSIKIALTYKSPFWQEEKLPSALFSQAGPITEFYDHCNHERSKFALCGFTSVSFKQLTYSERKSRVIEQVKLVFGKKAADFIDYEECIWSDERYTFEESDRALLPHQNNGNPIFKNSLFENRLFISSSESASTYPGYMEGAVYSGNVTAEKVIGLGK
ncbi:FAD-dependent oxidoreductase [Brumimicrobium glaciale]|uniref:FAD-dependent oxidoreductase n=1 Tax=Brumimicrobium glaciale TaxID=200475 RepID=A0A4Q4KEE7_9FLAO|nr:FAD-dependent oxidoreductase [Brumimicrobium glaciale]RYM31433.1 FAD-dependent oxidoreductase [Brumimicrobium glaciale]